jgi:putative ABC transport system permease protein
MERFRADVRAHVGQIEAALALGAAPAVTVAPFVQSGVYASLLPRLDMLKSLGLVWIPGVMAGMLVSGASPIYAGIFQFIIVAMILAASLPWQAMPTRRQRIRPRKRRSSSSSPRSDRLCSQ